MIKKNPGFWGKMLTLSGQQIRNRGSRVTLNNSQML